MSSYVKFEDRWHEAISFLPPAERGEFYCKLFDILFDGAEPDFEGHQASIWVMVEHDLESTKRASDRGRAMAAARWGENEEPQVDASAMHRQCIGNAQAYAEADAQEMHMQCSSNAQAYAQASQEKKEEKEGKKEGKKEKNQKKESKKEREKEKEEEKGEKKIQKEKSARFAKPTLSELSDYIAEKGYHFDAESFIAFYESKGWKVGTSPMKNWKAACTTWEKRWKTDHPAPSKVSSIWGTDDTAEGWGNVWTG